MRIGTFGAIVTTTVAAALWLGAPSGHGKHPRAPERQMIDEFAGEPAARIAASAPETAAAAVAQNPPVTRMLTVARGDTLMALLVKAGVPRREAHGAIEALRPVFKPRDLMPGLAIAVTRQANAPGGTLQLQKLDMEPDARHRVVLQRNAAGQFEAAAIERKLTTRLVQADGVISSSLYHAGRRAKLPPPVLAGLIRIFSFDVDFQRDVQPEDSFDIMYERLHDNSGEAVDEGVILIAEMTLSGKQVRLYRHRTADGEIDYYDAKGRSVRKALVLTPIDGARISSRYGRRRHPILGYTKMHRGIDFAAPRGTPVYAAGRGVIEIAGRNGAYGRYIRIRHNGTYKTAYAHLKGYARGIRRGKRVRQGQVIGYVGSSGRSTGPHLHYEILRNGRQVNPKKLNLPSGRTLTGAELARFQKVRQALENGYAALPSRKQLAEQP